MEDIFNSMNLIMIGIIVFSSFWIFLFNYRQDHKEKYKGNILLIIFDLFINLGMSISGFLLILVVFNNVPQAQAYDSYKYPVGFLFGLTSNVSIPIVLKWFQNQITAKLSQVGKK
tara:strand:- start:915 stop:1259 length:345 start_codon:yes stop_codon:yes gene_type:complete